MTEISTQQSEAQTGESGERRDIASAADSRVGLWPCLIYRDGRAAIEFLTEAFGFQIGTIHEDDSGEVAHAELLWPEGGGVMLGTEGTGSAPFAIRASAGAVTYVVSSDPDAVHDRAVRLGADVVREPHKTDYGSRDCAFRDPEGNLWDFGTYPGSTLST